MYSIIASVNACKNRCAGFKCVFSFCIFVAVKHSLTLPQTHVSTRRSVASLQTASSICGTDAMCTSRGGGLFCGGALLRDDAPFCGLHFLVALTPHTLLICSETSHFDL